MTTATTTTTTFAGDFARLIPRNQLAQRLFSKSYIYVEEKSDFHLQFMRRIDDALVFTLDDPVESSTEYDDPSDAELLGLTDVGHFVLSFHHEPENPHLGWKTGRGTGKEPKHRNVDFLCARPGDSLARSLASVHMIFRFNPRSGFLMLMGGSRKVPVEYKFNGKWEKLEYEQTRVLYLHSTMIRAGNCEYELEYSIQDGFKDAYLKERDQFLNSILPNDNSQPLVFQEMPGDNWVLRKSYIELKRQGSGGFGWITKGVDLTSGDPVAIKEICLKGSEARQQACSEIDIGRSCPQPGLLPTLEAFCEHGTPDTCSDTEKLYIIMPLARSDFSHISNWANPEIPRSCKLQWMRGPLEGIQALHAKGIMHRDVTLRNMLILSSKPPQAALCDYGKATKAKSSRNTAIGPKPTLAPEVWKNVPYTAKIDLWAYGYALVRILGIVVPNNSQITHHTHTIMYAKLQMHAEEVTEDRLLVDLIMKLVVWDPDRRLSAEAALQHECWNAVGAEEHPDEKIMNEQGSKRKYLEGSRSTPDGTNPDPTQEFSTGTRQVIAKRMGL